MLQTGSCCDLKLSARYPPKPSVSPKQRFPRAVPPNNADSGAYNESFVPGREMRALVEEAFGELETVPTDPSAPARLFKVPG